jgi:hypothetical protein
MLEKLLAKKAGGAAASGAGGAPGRASSGRQLGRAGAGGIERRLSGTGSGNAGLLRALSDVDVRQKAATALVTGLKKAVEEAQARQQLQQADPAANGDAAATAADEQQHGGREAGAGPSSTDQLQLPDPQQLAETIELELFKLCGELFGLVTYSCIVWQQC